MKRALQPGDGITLLVVGQNSGEPELVVEGVPKGAARFATDSPAYKETVHNGKCPRAPSVMRGHALRSTVRSVLQFDRCRAA